MTNPNDNEERRAYWAARMEEAFAFMGYIRQYPVAECGEPVVSLVDAVAGAGVEVVFSQRPHVQGLPRLYLLRAGLLDDFIGCAREMNECGWVMKVEDAFRTLTMQKHLARAPYTFDVVLERLFWECNGTHPPVELVTRRVGSAIDISVLVRAHPAAS